MEVLPRAVAGSSVVVTASAASKESSSSAAEKRNVQVSLPSGIPFLRPASALVASILASAPPAALAALNYDEFVKKASESASSAANSAGSSFPELPSIELPSVGLPTVDFDGATDFVSANPFALVAGLAAVAVPFIASRAFAGPTSFGSVSAVEAYERLADLEQNAELLDIRAVEDIKVEGSPNLKSIRKTSIKVAYAADDDKFVDKVLAKCKVAENTTLYVLDSFDGSATIVAKLLANSGFKSAYAVKGGSNGWLDKELPWTTPSKSFNLNIDGLKNIIPDGEGVDSASLSTTLGVAAVAGIGIVAFSEVETTLQVLGAVALVQLFVKKFLFAKDRKKTVEDIRTFLDTKIAPKGFVDEIKEVGRALLPKEGEIKAAIGTGAAVLEKELNVDSVTPETLAEKAKEKLGEEAEKAGVEIPDFEGATADLKSGAKELQSNVEAITTDLKSGAQYLQIKAEEVTSDLRLKTENLSSDLESDVKAVGSDLKTSAEEAKSAVESTAESVNSSNGSAAPKPAAKKVDPFFEDERDSTQAAFEGDKPTSVEQVGEGTSAKKVDPFFEDERDSAQAAFEGDKPTAVEQVGEGTSAKKVDPFFEDERDSAQAAFEGDKPTAVEQVGEDTSAKKVDPFFEDERDSALAAFEGDEPTAVEQVGEDISAKKLKEVTTSGAADTSS